MKTEVLPADHPTAIAHANDVLRHGGLVAFPTDTVYGLAVLPNEEATVGRLYTVKGRNSQKAISILVGDVSQLECVADRMGPMATQLADRFWPGPLTLVVPRHSSLPSNLSPDPTIGVRMPDHPVVLALLRHVGPLAVTSANLSGQAIANTAQEVLAQLKGRIHLILDGGHTPGGVPSTVVDCTGTDLVLLRPGPISYDDLCAALH
jgi:L-threonylcarbamoyladenylate synthase